MPTRVDLAPTAVLLVLSQVEVWAFGVAGGGAAGAAIVASAALVSTWRSRFPVASTLVVIAILFAAVGPGSVTCALAVILGFYYIGAAPNRRVAYVVLLAALVVAVPMTENISLAKYLGIALASFVVPWLIGALHLRHRSAQELERERRTAVAQERARLARELHDLVSHNVGMIVVQAGAGDVLLDRDPERAREALRAIESGARDALLELRRLLGLLREDDEAQLAPQPTLARLDELVERVRATGVDVVLRVEGEPGQIDAAVDLSAYRIVQEALTNVLKHSGATHVRVDLRRHADGLEIEVVDDGTGGDGSRHGHGLVGMAERVALLGGELEAGAQAERGYRLRALLPV